MTILRNPIRSTARSPLRGALESKFGGISNPLSLSAPGEYLDEFANFPLDIGGDFIFADTEDVGGNYVATLTAAAGTTLTATGWTGTGTNVITKTDTIANLNASIDLAAKLALGISAAGNDGILVTFVRSSDSAAASPKVITVVALPAVPTAAVAESIASGMDLWPELTTGLAGTSAVVTIDSDAQPQRPVVTTSIATDNADGTFTHNYSLDTGDGDYYWIADLDDTVLTGEVTAANSAGRIIAGNNLLGATAAASGTAEITASGVQAAITSSALPAGTYYVQGVHVSDAVDGEGNRLTSEVEYTTVAVTAPVASKVVTDLGAYSGSLDNNADVTFSVNIGTAAADRFILIGEVNQFFVGLPISNPVHRVNGVVLPELVAPYDFGGRYTRWSGGLVPAGSGLQDIDIEHDGGSFAAITIGVWMITGLSSPWVAADVVDAPASGRTIDVPADGSIFTVKIEAGNNIGAGSTEAVTGTSPAGADDHSAYWDSVVAANAAFIVDWERVSDSFDLSGANISLP